MRIDEMPAGREMDALKAEKIMGYTLSELSLPAYPKYKLFDIESGEFSGYVKEVPHYSTDIADAWEVVKRMPIPFKLEKCWEKAYQIGPEGWSACWCTDADCEGCNENSRCTNGDDAWAETAPLAICRYALKVAGVEI
jgi:hypothetical protein